MVVARRGLLAGASKLVLGAAALSILGAAVAEADGDEGGAQMPPLSPETAGRYADLGYDPQQVYAVFAGVQAAFRARDVAKLSELISFPMLLKTPDASVRVQSARELGRYKDKIFSDDLRAVVSAQEFETLFLSSDGMMFGDGQIWLQAQCPDQACTTSMVRIVTINMIK
jgi:hypothetical protein